MLRELIRMGREGAGEGDVLEDLVQEASGTLYLLDLYPEERRASLVPYELDGEKCRRFLWVGDPPASNAPRDRATTSRLHYLLGQAATKMAEDGGLYPLLKDLLWDPGKPGGKACQLLDLRGFRLEGAREGAEGPFRVAGGRLEVVQEPWPFLKEKKRHAGGLAEALGEFLEKVWDLPKKGALFSLALRGRPLAEVPEYRAYLRRTLLEERFARGEKGLCHGCGRVDRVVADSSAFRLKFFIQDKKGFAPGVREEAFPRAYALCRECFTALKIGERLALERLTLRFLGTEALVLPGADPEPGGLTRLVERVLAQVRGLERLEAWRDFLERAQLRWEEVGYLGFSLLFFRRARAATKVEEMVLEVPPSRVEGLFGALAEAQERGFPVRGLGDWLHLLPLAREGGGVDAGPVLPWLSRILLGLHLDPKDLLPLWLRAAERAYREDATLYALDRYRGPQGTLDLALLGAGWIWVLRRLGLWGGRMEREVRSAFPLGEEEEVFRAYGFGPLEAGLYLLGKAMEVVGQAQARLYEYRKEPLLEALGWQGMSLVRVRYLVPEVMAKAVHYLDGEERTLVLDLLGRATDLLERAEGGLSEREIPYYLLMGYAQARSQRLRQGRKAEQDQEGVEYDREGA
ncbi:TM1802 family CRISPR-associated protein [Thermus thermophilus]|uniref:TM1802 family CRISPR-associated protein n=1 Tax=Thermus thermophilus TaxID=274 RepID=UPI0003A0A171|nr:TM1802 family CRISPR-associated protein [Thermus thermophilus]